MADRFMGGCIDFINCHITHNCTGPDACLVNSVTHETCSDRLWIVDDLFDNDPDADFATIEAIDAAIDGDEIRVMPGTYTNTNNDNQVVDLGKAVWLHGLDGERDNTIIDGGSDARGVYCGVASGAILQNFTIRNCDGGSPWMRWGRQWRQDAELQQRQPNGHQLHILEQLCLQRRWNVQRRR